MSIKHGKKYNEAQKQIVKEYFSLNEAVELLKKTSTTKFDSTCEIHINLGIDPKQADQNIRTTVDLPYGTGKEVRIVAFVSDENINAAKSAGAVLAGTQELIDKIEKGWADFDCAVATPDQMKSLAKIAKILGQKRLMPNPKAGTVTTDFKCAIEDLKKGKVEVRIDKGANLHNVVGKVSFNENQLEENIRSYLKAVLEAKPTGVKGTYIKKISLCTSMGPGINLDVAATSSETR